MASDEFVKKPPTPGKPLRFRFPPAPRLGDAYAVAELVELGYGYEGGGRAGEGRRLSPSRMHSGWEGGPVRKCTSVCV